MYARQGSGFCAGLSCCPGSGRAAMAANPPPSLPLTCRAERLGARGGGGLGQLLELDQPGVAGQSREVDPHELSGGLARALGEQQPGQGIAAQVLECRRARPRARASPPRAATRAISSGVCGRVAERGVEARGGARGRSRAGAAPRAPARRCGARARRARRRGRRSSAACSAICAIRSWRSARSSARA